MARITVFLVVALVTARAVGDPAWVVDPRSFGPDLPPSGRSLFDHLVASNGTYEVPFPFTALLAAVAQRLSKDVYLDRPLKSLLIPLGRSLQRDAAAPHYFRSPRAVVAVDGEPTDQGESPTMLLRDRLYLGYLEEANVLEVISYNEAAGRFEFQVVSDYRQDGTKNVTYARRALCLACHQNAAPIFARPLWDETNANQVMARLLGDQDRSFYGLPTAQTIDVAYAIDNATDRANEFALTQRLWQEGCGAGTDGDRCRGALFIAALQLALTRHRGFADNSLEYRTDGVQQMQKVRTQLWPEGLWLSNPDIPNRTAFQFAALEGTQHKPNIRLLSDIPARLEPLSPRSAKTTWNPEPEEWSATAVRGLEAFLADTDIRQLDAHLARLPTDQRRFTGACELQRRASGTDRLKINCVGEEVGLRGRVTESGNGELSGRLSQLELAGNRFGFVPIAGSKTGLKWQLAPVRAEHQTTLRLSSGDAIATIVLQESDEVTGSARIVVTVREDFLPVVTAIRSMVDDADDGISAQSFRRAVALRALFTRLGIPNANWCCATDDHLPPPRLSTDAETSGVTTATPFFQVCATCHRSDERFPPNFLAGSSKQVTASLVHCGERIKYRLGMWTLEPEQRNKTPMPPQHALARLGVEPEGWPGSDQFAALRLTLDQLAREQGARLPATEELLVRDYADLRTCLPET